MLRSILFSIALLYVTNLSAQFKTGLTQDQLIKQKFDVEGLVSPNGFPETNIELLTIPGLNNLDYPLVISFDHVIRAKQEPSWVGLGFTLSQGAITRSINKLPDEQKSIWFKPSSPSSNKEFDLDLYGTITDPDDFPETDGIFNNPVGDCLSDGCSIVEDYKHEEFDDYRVSTPFFSGKIIPYRNSASDYNLNFALENYQPVKFIPISGSNQTIFKNQAGENIIDRFDVTDPSGNYYRFDQASDIEIKPKSGNLPAPGQWTPGNLKYNFHSAWYLSRINNFDNSAYVDFEYTLMDPRQYDNQHPVIIGHSKYPGFSEGNSFGCDVNYKLKVISKIETNNYKAIFLSQENTFFNTTQLKEISLFRKSTNELVKKIRLTYGGVHEQFLVKVEYLDGNSCELSPPIEIEYKNSSVDYPNLTEGVAFSDGTWSISSIVFPTGKKIQYEYEPAQYRWFYNTNDNQYSMPALIFNSGTQGQLSSRLKTIKIGFKGGSTNKTISYSYGEGVLYRNKVEYNNDLASFGYNYQSFIDASVIYRWVEAQFPDGLGKIKNYYTTIVSSTFVKSGTGVNPEPITSDESFPVVPNIGLNIVYHYDFSRPSLGLLWKSEIFKDGVSSPIISKFLDINHNISINGNPSLTMNIPGSGFYETHVREESKAVRSYKQSVTQDGLTKSVFFGYDNLTTIQNQKVFPSQPIKDFYEITDYVQSLADGRLNLKNTVQTYDVQFLEDASKKPVLSVNNQLSKEFYTYQDFNSFKYLQKEGKVQNRDADEIWESTSSYQNVTLKEYLGYNSNGLPTLTVDILGNQTHNLYGYGNQVLLGVISKTTSLAGFVDDFNDGSLTDNDPINWTNQKGSIVLESGKLILSRNSFAQDAYLRVTNPDNSIQTFNADLEFSIEGFDPEIEPIPNQPLTNAYIGLHFGVGGNGTDIINPKTNGFLVALFSDGQIGLFKNGISLSKVQSSIDFSVKTNLSLKMTNDRINLYLNGFRVISHSVVTSTLPIGFVGLTTSHATGNFDNIRVYPENGEMISYGYLDKFMKPDVFFDENYTKTQVEYDASGRINRVFNDKGLVLQDYSIKYSINQNSGLYSTTSPNFVEAVKYPNGNLIRNSSFEDTYKTDTFLMGSPLGVFFVTNFTPVYWVGNWVNGAFPSPSAIVNNGPAFGGKAFQVYNLTPAGNTNISQKIGLLGSGTYTLTLWYVAASGTKAKIVIGDTDSSDPVPNENIKTVEANGNGSWQKLSINYTLTKKEKVVVSLYGGTAADPIFSYVIYDMIILESGAVSTSPIIEREYFDYSGNSIQKTIFSNNSEMVTPVEYDLFGRVIKSWNSYQISGTLPMFHSNFSTESITYFNSKSISHNNKPFIESIYEPIPEGRLLTINHAGGFGSKSYSYSSENYDFKLGGGTNWLCQTTQITDEDNNKTKTVYNNLGFGVKNVSLSVANIPTIVTSSDFDVLGRIRKIYHPDESFSVFRYDSFGKLTAKETPYLNNDESSGEVNDVRNRFSDAGLLRFTIDANQAHLNQMSYFKYDISGRIIEEGTISSIGTFTFENANNMSYPNGAGEIWTTHYFYDSEYSFNYGTNTVLTENTKGRLVKKEEVISGGTGAEIITSYYSYDKYGNLSGYYVFTPAYRFKETMTYSINNQILTRLQDINGVQHGYYTYFYDTFLRVNNVKFGVPGSSYSPLSIATYSYNPDGTVNSETLGNGIQTRSYKYNVRGFLTSINPGTPTSSASFSEILNYWSTSLTGSAAKYNGLLSEVGSKFYGAPVSTLYQQFKYDEFNRLSSSVSFSSSMTTPDNFYNTQYTYDVMGNILTQQVNKKVNGVSTTVDNLVYTYNSGFLESVNELAGNQYGYAVNPGIFVYDYNGNLTSDPNRQYFGFVYNNKNLPISFEKANFQIVKYGYTQNGNRIFKNQFPGNSINYYIRDNDGNIVGEFNSSGNPTYPGLSGYTNIYLSYINYFGKNKEIIGKKVFGGSGGEYFNLKDHLGNIRMTVKKSGTSSLIVDKTDFYPYGSVMEEIMSNSTPELQKFKYQGKERDLESGYDYFEARFYDSQLGRFLQPDPMAGKSVFQSPFVSMNNDPVNMIDPTGNYSWKWLQDLVNIHQQKANKEEDEKKKQQQKNEEERKKEEEKKKAEAQQKAANASSAASTAWVMTGSTIEIPVVGEIFAAFAIGLTIYAIIQNVQTMSSSGNFVIPDDPTVPPGEGWEWRGKGKKGSREGSWHNPQTGESLHPDLNHGLPIGPHWDYKDSDGVEWRIFPDGNKELKK